MVVKKAEELKRVIKKILMSAGADERNAIILADTFVSSDLSGVSTHGIYKLPQYIGWIKDRILIPDQWPEIIKETANTALVKGNWTFGQTTAKFSMELAIKKAKKNNISIVSGVQVTHTGRLGEYSEMAADQKMISFMFNGGFSENIATAAPYGGRKAVLAPNPFTMGFPAGKEPPMITDIATSSVSHTKVVVTKKDKKLCEEGWICDKYGNPSINPDDLFDGGALLPFGGHKGYAFMLATEFLGRIFSGADLFTEKDIGGPHFSHSGFTMIVFKPDIFSTYKDYIGYMDDVMEKIREIPPAPGFDKVLIPGDVERRTKRERLKNGIPIPVDVWESIINLADSLGVKGIK